MAKTFEMDEHNMTCARVLEEMEWATIHTSGKAVTSELYTMVLADEVYFVWHERNIIISKNKKHSIESIIR